MRSPYFFAAKAFKRGEYLVINELIWVITVVRKDIYAAALKVLQDRGGAGGGAALTVFALAYDIPPLPLCPIDKLGKCIGFLKIGFIRIAEIGEDLDIDIGNHNVKYAIARAAEIHPTLHTDVPALWAVKAYNRAALRKAAF